MGVIIILSVQALVSLAILVYYERHHRDEAHWWRTRLGPIDLAIVLAGVGAAFYFKKRRPEKYEQAGRLINEGL